jgi:hypothetical protein
MEELGTRVGAIFEKPLTTMQLRNGADKQGSYAYESDSLSGRSKVMPL